MKHYTLDDRLRVQRGLTINLNFTEIGNSIGKDRTSVSREIQAHWRGEGKPARSKCKHRNDCIFNDPAECPAPSCNKRTCSIACSQCARYCDRYEPEICPKLMKPPYVCNGCKDRGDGCHLEKRLYDAEYAHNEYKHTLSDSRSGISLTENELKYIEETVIPLVRNGVSVHIAYDAYADSMPVSERTLYDYIDKGVFSIGNLDLRRKVSRKPSRDKSGPVLHVDKKCHVGRTYADFEEYISDHPDLNVNEMDTVEGNKGGKVILTIFFRDCDLQLMFLRDVKNAANVTAVFLWLRQVLGKDFSKVFKVILTDRGTEFTDPVSIEFDPCTGEQLCRLFYCDPQQTNQKSRCERNHEYIRYIRPKGHTFDDLKPEDVTLMMNHVNSMPRASLNGKAPIQVFHSIYGEETAAKLGLKYIPLEELLLKPELLKK
ncbi:MAG: IS30 family transposase [Oscillospiraceae bacterium]|nr:IS30 family transposase [Oscillospiraceae bacterium]